MHTNTSTIHNDKLAVNDVSFCQQAVTELLVKENNSVANICNSLHHVHRDSCMGASSVQVWVNTSKIVIETSLIYFTVVDQEPASQNATNI
jgi:hypothetical protein